MNYLFEFQTSYQPQDAACLSADNQRFRKLKYNFPHLAINNNCNMLHNVTHQLRPRAVLCRIQSISHGCSRGRSGAVISGREYDSDAFLPASIQIGEGGYQDDKQTKDVDEAGLTHGATPFRTRVTSGKPSGG